MITPLKTFVRRRNMLVFMHSRKMDHIFDQEEKELMRGLHDKQFTIAMGLKMLSVVLLSHLRLYKRPAGRSWMFDLGLLYFSAYAFVGSCIPGVFLTWPHYD